MKNKFKILFFRQDVLKLSTFILLFLALLSGFSIIYSIEYLSGSFSVANIYAMFSTISNFLLIFLSVNLFGKEFRYKSINMIRISSRSAEEIIFRKLFVMIATALLTAFIVFLEVLFYKFFFHHTDMDTLRVFTSLVLSYSVYSVFLFLVGSLLVFFLKNTLSSFISLLLILRLGVATMNILSNFKLTSQLVKYIPLSFIEQSFYFANYTTEEFMIILIWSVILLLFLVKIYKKRGYK